jgi:hypothetical protein
MRCNFSTYSQNIYASLSPRGQKAARTAAVTVSLALALVPLTQRSAHAQLVGCTINGCTYSNGPSFPTVEVLNCRTSTSSGPFVFMCRGYQPTSNWFFKSDVGGTLTPFVPNASGAGSTGASLTPGTCAFKDRTLRSTEPHLLFKRYTSTVSGDTLSSPVDGATNILTQCATNQSCVFAVCVINESVHGLQVMHATTSVGGGDADIITIYPSFPAP